LLGNLYPSNINAEKTEQVGELLEQIEVVLKSALMDYSNVIRTWFYLDDILSWYLPFNTVRTDFYQKRNVFDNIVPASTGISGSNFYKAAVSAAVWATQPECDAFSKKEVLSPLQCPAPCYGSSSVAQ
jgi:enamine deaminase RidA (YjgF/YER057c/UK114 family)